MYKKQVACGLLPSGLSTFVISGKCCLEGQKTLKLFLETQTCNDRVQTHPRVGPSPWGGSEELGVRCVRINVAQCQFMLNPRMRFICVRTII